MNAAEATPPPALAVASSVAPLVDPVFISDLHLTSERPRTLERFLRFLREDAPLHPELVILGDLFEFWIGDDAGAAAAPVIAALASASRRGQRVLVMHGNRDLLLGSDFARTAGCTLLADPISLEVAGTPTLLSHGDAWCTRDVAYQQFRTMVRAPAFQRDFLAKPVAERIQVARSARMQSETEKAMKAADIMDVTTEVVSAAMVQAGVRRVIHGHTHRPGTHVHEVNGALAERWVLPDWDSDAAEPRGGFLDFDRGRPRLVFFDD
ncbi:MAG TPA: UDP-2,3-diacylglucosamine diphosphatase [Burkholderiaceae bacterium]|nr:UDP-2,3-diacylglucosamine diphosphatase [Burkholderiaceae bacterium]